MSKVNSIDEERSQSRARFVICWISLAVFLVVGYLRGDDHQLILTPGLATILGYLVFSTAWYTMVCRYPNQHPRRRNISVVADLGIMTAFMHIGGEHVATFYPLFLWIIIGNGIRFGEKFLFRGLVVGTVGFASVLIFNDYWQKNLYVGSGLLLGVIILPVFYQGVLRRLRAMADLKVELARSRLADKAKDQFLATMSHELRTPMNGVLGMAEVLADTELDTDQRDHLHIITRSVESLLHIINDILDYSKITSNELELEKVPVDLNQLMQDVYLLLKTSADAKGIDLVFNYPVHAHRHFSADPTRIRQIIFNLVGNAIKFTEQGYVKMSCMVLQDSLSQNVVLVVEDTGIGIPEDRLEAVFDQFEQADNSTTRRYGGTGLGLAISRRLAGLMDGDIIAESEVGQGSTFTASMSLQECDAPQEQVAPEPDELPNFGLKALVAEDNKFNQVVIRQLLRRIGITVDIMDNGAKAVEQLARDSYDLVFMDIRMPVMNGYEATQAIRCRKDDLAKIPIIAITADATRADVSQSMDAGMDVHLSKPLRLAQVVDALKSLDILPAVCV